jgi:hypothetical protein
MAVWQGLDIGSSHWPKDDTNAKNGNDELASCESPKPCLAKSLMMSGLISVEGHPELASRSSNG